MPRNLKKSARNASKDLAFYSFQFLLAALLTAPTGFLGAVPFFSSYRAQKKAVQILALVLVVGALNLLGFSPLDFFLISFFVMVQTFFGLNRATLFLRSVAATAAPWVLGMTVWFAMPNAMRADWMEKIQSELAKQLRGTLAEVIDWSQVWSLVPGIYFVFLSFTCFFGIAFSSRWSVLFKLQSVPDLIDSVALRLQMVYFRLPDFLVFVVILTFPLAFMEVGFPILLVQIAKNAILAFFAGYFFQGLALAVWIFDTQKVGPFWRLVFYLLLALQLQLTLFVSIFGFADFWLNLRKKLAIKPD